MTAPALGTRPPIWRDIRVVRAVLQVAFVVAAVALVLYLWDNLRIRLDDRNIETSYDFLDQPTGFAIPFSDLRPSQPVRDAFGVAARNTAASAVTGIGICALLGLIVGIARLSSNWLVRKAAALYVETLRNLPPLLIILFVNNAVLLQLPPIGDAIEVGDLAVISNGQMAVASPQAGTDAGAWFGLLAGAALVAIGVRWWRRRVHDRTGAPMRLLWWTLVPWMVLAAVSYLVLEGPVTMSRPAVDGFRVVGGAAMNIPFAAVTVALALYTSSHVAEIVRGSILAVPRGQNEAATALGLSTMDRLRHVVLPQAFRIAIPPTINQFLNLTKNTSLGIAVAYTELTTLGFILIGNGQPAPQTVSVVMAVYLSFSIVISILLNIYNRRLALQER
jgi:general L-amino acid transport system permease protein